MHQSLECCIHFWVIYLPIIYIFVLVFIKLLLINFILILFKISYGIQFESVAKEAFEKLFGFNVTPAGLFVAPHLPFLAVTLDRHIGSDSIIEIKCIPSIKDFTPQDTYGEKI